MEELWKKYGGVVKKKYTLPEGPADNLVVRSLQVCLGVRGKRWNPHL
jgi:hypothetical protein